MGFEDKWLDDLFEKGSTQYSNGSSLACLKAPAQSHALAASSLPKIPGHTEVAPDGGLGEFLKYAVIITDPRDRDK